MKVTEDVMALPLDGVRVLDPTAGMVGPYTTMFLADMGAEVIKIEPPGGESGRGRPGFHLWNRGKRSVVIDPAAPDFAAQFSRLLATCDVLVNDERTPFPVPPYSALAVDHPNLIYLSLPPYGRDNPYEDWPADEGILQALTGVMGTQGAIRPGPVFMVHSVVSSYTALFAAGLVAEALYSRERLGRGLEVALPWVSASACVALPTRADNFPRALMQRSPDGGQPAYRLYRASDAWLVMACTNPLFWNRLCIALDAPHLVADPRYENAPWGVAPEDQPGLVASIAAILATKTRDEWLEIFTANDVPSAPVLSREAYLESDLVAANNLRITIDDPQVGAVSQMGAPLRVDGQPLTVSAPAPSLGADTQAVLAGIAKAPAQQARRRGAAKIARPLAGIRVLDFTTYLGGPFSGMLLAEAGADVVKVEPPAGEGFRTTGISGLMFNMGKRGLAIDLRTDRGREVLLDMLTQADVVLEGFRTGVTKRMGMDYETIRQRNPRIVYCSLTGFGEYAALQAAPSFDPILQARSGQSLSQGGGTRPVLAGIAMNDYAAGFLTHYGILMGLYQRELTGKGCRIQTTQAGAALTVQSEEVTRFRGAPPVALGGPDFVGPAASYRVYEASDGNWVFLAIRSAEDWQRFVAAAPVDAAIARHAADDAVRQPAEGDLADALGNMFRTQSREAWARLGLDRDVRIVPVMLTDGDGIELPIYMANEMLNTVTHPVFGPMTGRGETARLSAFAETKFNPPPWIGEHNEAILRDYGYSDQAVKDLASTGVLAAPPFRM